MDEYTAYIEWLGCGAGCIRVYPPGLSYTNHDRYNWACTIFVIDEDIVEFKGVTKVPSRQQMRAMNKVLVQHGFRVAYWERHKKDLKRVVVKLRG